MPNARFKSPRYIAFIKRQPCCRAHLHGKDGRPEWSPFYFVIDPEHTVSQKWEAGSDGLALPLCRYCHDERHHPSPKMIEWRRGRDFYPASGIQTIVEIVRLHKLFLREEQLQMLPSETFEQCLERNGLGSHARSKRRDTVAPNNIKKRKKDERSSRKAKKPSMWEKFTKKFIPPDWK